MDIRERSRRPLRVALFAAVALSIGACTDDSGPGNMMFVNPSTIRVANNLLGPVLFFRARTCGTTDWGPDLLPSDPVTGTIQPGASRDFTVEAGCYDLQAQHLETTEPGPLMTKEDFDRTASPVAILEWSLEDTPSGPN